MNIASASGGLLTSARFWFYQDFAAGSGPVLTLTGNDNGTGGAAWDSANVIDGSAAVTNTDGNPIFDDAAELPADTVEVTAHVGASVTLSSTPLVGQGAVRVWFLYLVSASNAPTEMEVAPRFVKESRTDFLDTHYLNHGLNLSDVQSVTTSLTNLGFTAQTAGNVLLGDGGQNFTSDADLFFDVSNTRLGIGTNVPDQQLHVLSNTAPTVLLSTQSTNVPDFRFQAARAANADLQNGDTVGLLSYYARFNTSTGTIGEVLVDYTGDGTTRIGDFVLNLSNGGAPAERLRVTGAGLLTVGSASISQAGLGSFVTARVSTSLVIEDPGAGSNTITIQAPDPVANTYVLILPDDQGTGALTNDGSGNLSWVAAGTGTVASGVAGRLALYPATGTTVDDVYVQNANDVTVAIATHTGLAAARAYTVPDSGADASFVMTESAQTLNGVKTFSAKPSFQAGIGLQETGGGSDLVTLGAAASSAAYTLLLPGAQGSAGDTLSNDGSGNLSWARLPTFKAGKVDLTDGLLSVAVTFVTPLAAPLALLYTPSISFRDTVSGDPVYQPYTIIAQSENGFTVEWNDGIIGNNVDLLWSILVHYDP